MVVVAWRLRVCPDLNLLALRHVASVAGCCCHAAVGAVVVVVEEEPEVGYQLDLGQVGQHWQRLKLRLQPRQPSSPGEPWALYPSWLC